MCSQAPLHTFPNITLYLPFQVLKCSLCGFSFINLSADPSSSSSLLHPHLHNIVLLNFVLSLGNYTNISFSSFPHHKNSVISSASISWRPSGQYSFTSVITLERSPVELSRHVRVREGIFPTTLSASLLSARFLSNHCEIARNRSYTLESEKKKKKKKKKKTPSL
ncbi:hypothetical protein B9Z55_014860 [Caenorhabditis nigoni]|uniref:Uncharacterized protein n=1 Tax=Caenorhabditis nigoni TaxID=1611254 RepID=A0A2G5U834_9PELO|nr:hypothetical protein B9Z55_014860 [Caenorhabditis nigoni]